MIGQVNSSRMGLSLKSRRLVSVDGLDELSVNSGHVVLSVSVTLSPCWWVG